MNEFFCFNIDSLGIVRMVESGGKLFRMTENRYLYEVGASEKQIFLGPRGGTLLSSTVMSLLSWLDAAADVALERTIRTLQADMVRYGLRCSTDDIIEPRFTVKETAPGEYELSIGLDGATIFGVHKASEEFCKMIGRCIIDYAIALGIDIRVNWEFKHLTDFEDNDK